jgi:hypothetical protein
LSVRRSIAQFAETNHPVKQNQSIQSNDSFTASGLLQDLSDYSILSERLQEEVEFQIIYFQFDRANSKSTFQDLTMGQDLRIPTPAPCGCDWEMATEV